MQFACHFNPFMIVKNENGKYVRVQIIGIIKIKNEMTSKQTQSNWQAKTGISTVKKMKL